MSSTYAELAESYGAGVTGVDDLNQTFELLLRGGFPCGDTFKKRRRLNYYTDMEKAILIRH